jgi:hypothetical protein
VKKTAWSPPSQPIGSYPSTTASSTGATSASSTSTTSPVPTPKPRHTGAIIGGVVGGIACIVLVGLAYLLGRRRRRTTAEDDHDRGWVVKSFSRHELESPDIRSLPDSGSLLLELPAKENPGVELEVALPELQAEASEYLIPRKPIPRLL